MRVESSAIRALIRGLYTGAVYAGHAVRGRNPWKVVREYKSSRGMNFHNDVHDWLGGYPYESATPQEVQSKVCAMGFERVADYPLAPGLGLFGTGCAEYVFRRTA